MGTLMQQQGIDLGAVPEALNITHPEIVQAIQKEYIDAGADIICTCSFGVNEYKLRNCEYTAEQLIRAAVKNARQAAEGTGAKVALDIGPIGKLLEPNGDLTFEEAYAIFKRQILAGEGCRSHYH